MSCDEKSWFWLRGAASLRPMAAIVLILLSTFRGSAAVEIEALQQSINKGEAARVVEKLTDALLKDPTNPYLLYDRAVAYYASQRFEEALMDLDLVETSKFRSLANKAQFQKGNAEFQIGTAAATTDIEATIAHWKNSLSSYKSVMKEEPGNSGAQKNYEAVRQRLLSLLMAMAEKNLMRGMSPASPPEQRISYLRTAMDQFHDALDIDPKNQPARDGEEKARNELAKLLAEEGTRKTLTTQLVRPAPNEPAIPQPDLEQIQEGVNMLEDAKELKPDDRNIPQQLEQGRQRLADALALRAEIYQKIEPQIPRMDDKQAILRMAMESLDRALEQVPNHAHAKELQEQIKQRLAQIHEQQGDQLMQTSEMADLEDQAQQLSQALDHFQQAQDLQPQQKQLQKKGQQAQDQLENTLNRLADKLMKQPGGETPEEAVARLEGASEALSELQGLKPSSQTSEKARQVGRQLEALRQQLASSGKKQNGRDRPSSGTKESDALVPPVDAPPRLDTSGSHGKYHSSALNHSLRDY